MYNLYHSMLLVLVYDQEGKNYCLQKIYCLLNQLDILCLFQEIMSSIEPHKMLVYGKEEFDFVI